MGLKDIFLILILILIFGTVIFGSLGSFFRHVNIAVSDVADAVADEKTFTVELLEKNSPSHLYKEHSGSDVSNKQYSDSQSSGKQYSSRDVSQKGTVNNDVSGKKSSEKDSPFWNFSFIDILDIEGNSSEKKYEDYQIDQETGMFDSEENPIYLSIVSTSGGQMSPGIYEVYWSKLKVFNHTKIQ